MAQDPKTTLLVDDFPGLVNNADPTDIPVGSGQDQVNAQSRIPGELRVRGGYVPVVFAND